MNNSYDSHVRDGVYSGEDPILQECFSQAQRLRHSAQFMNALLTAGKQVKGMLNEDQYDDRLGQNRNSPDALMGIVGQQEVRRCEYFRVRVLLQHHILPEVADALGRCVELTRLIDGRKPSQLYGSSDLKLDEYSALGAILSTVHEQDVFAQYGRAIEFVSEPDATNGKGEEALEREANVIDHFVYWRETIIPVEFQLVQSPRQHELDRALLAEISRLEPFLKSCLEEVETLEAMGPYYKGERKLHTSMQGARWPELFWRVSRYAQSGSEHWIDGYDPGWQERYAQTFNKLLTELRAGIATMNDAERWLAQSNSIGASYRIVRFLQGLEAGSFNLTIGASRIGGDLRQQTNALVQKFLKKAEGLG